MRIAFAYNVKHTDPTATFTGSPDLDFDSPLTITQIITVIRSLGHQVLRIEANNTAFEKLKKHRNVIDLVFNIAEGLGGDARESQIPLFCEMLALPYTHSSPTTLALALDKHYTKHIVKSLGFHVPAAHLLTSPTTPIPLRSLNKGWPLILKPNAEGSSIGVLDRNVVDDTTTLNARLKEIAQSGYQGSLLLEQYIEGREFTVSLLGNKQPKVLPIIEQRFDFLPKTFHKIASLELKWLYEDSLKRHEDAYICPAKLSPKLQHEIETTSLAIYHELHIRDCARIDYRLGKNGTLYFLEINPLPGINPNPKEISYLPISARAAGISYKDLIATIIAEATQRIPTSPKKS